MTLLPDVVVKFLSPVVV